MHRFELPQATEAVQLAFLAALVTKLPARHFALKGGANLRYFLRSHRASEDMDFDVLGLEPWRLADKVGEALRAPVMAKLLAVHGITLTEVRSQKQTGTTQRWWARASAPGLSQPVSVTGEFSRRITAPEELAAITSIVRAEAVDHSIASRYISVPLVLPHYLPPASIQQKVAALALRAQNQPRDVFDLDFLLGTYPDAIPSPGEVDPAEAARAADRATELDYRSFADTVLPFIDPDVRSLFASREAWSGMQERVVAQLLALAS